MDISLPIFKQKKKLNIINPLLVEATINDAVMARSHLFIKDGKTFDQTIKSHDFVKRMDWFSTTFRKYILRECDNYCFLTDDKTYELVLAMGIDCASLDYFRRWELSDAVHPRPILSYSIAKEKGFLRNTKIEIVTKCLLEKQVTHVFTGLQDLQDLVFHFIDWILAKEVSGNSLLKMSVEQVMEKIKDWTEEIVKEKERQLLLKEEENDLKTSVEVWKKDDYRFVRLESREAYAREGRLMHHCVGGYWGRAGSIIYSLRDKKNIPLVTVEISDKKKLLSFKAFGNKAPNEELQKILLEALTDQDFVELYLENEKPSLRTASVAFGIAGEGYGPQGEDGVMMNRGGAGGNAQYQAGGNGGGGGGGPVFIEGGGSGVGVARNPCGEIILRGERGGN
jgi:hypothetical protein